MVAERAVATDFRVAGFRAGSKSAPQREGASKGARKPALSPGGEGAARCWGDYVHGAVASTFAGLDLSLLAKLASLSVLPFAHEDLAIVAGAYIIVNKLMPASLVALSLYGGIVASDFALYGIGAGARRLPWLNRFAISGRVQNFGDTLRRNIFGWWRCAGWCRAWCLSPSSPVAGPGCRSPGSRWRAFWSQHSTCR